MTVRAIYENGVFRPIDPVDLAEQTAVEVILPESDSLERKNQDEIFAHIAQELPIWPHRHRRAA